MKLVIPFFWYKRNIISYLLLPLSWLYRGMFFLKFFCVREVKFNKVTITIGNVTIGGAGKTPTAIAVGEILREKGMKYHFLSRGYLGRFSGPIMVDGKHRAVDVGDEALLLFKSNDVVISKKRYLAKELIDNLGVDCVIMDDGLQNSKVRHDIKILVVDVEFLFGNGFLIPAGPLREGYGSAMKRVDYIFYIGNKNTISKLGFYEKYAHKSFFAKYIPELSGVGIENGKSYFAFSAISNNNKFFGSLRDNGYHVKKTREYPDHYFYSEDDIENLLYLAKKEDLILITTSKDMVKIPGEYQKDIVEFKIKLQLEKEAEFTDNLMIKLRSCADVKIS